MLLLIVATVFFIGRGALQWPGAAKPPEPARQVPPFALSSQDFLSSLKDQAKSTNENVPGGMPSTLAEDTREATFREQATRLWVAANKYQGDCGIAAPLSKVEFIESLRQTPLKQILEMQGLEYAASQEVYVKEVLGNPETVKLCRTGKTGLFFSTLEFHRARWEAQKRHAKEFERQELARVQGAQEAESLRISAGQADSYRTFITAAIAFGLFMSVALVLIFARLESNLRGVHIVVRAPANTSARS